MNPSHAVAVRPNLTVSNAKPATLYCIRECVCSLSKAFKAPALMLFCVKSVCRKAPSTITFPAKKRSGAPSLNYADYFNQKLDRCLLNETRAPLERLCDFVAEACEGMAKHDYRRGCLVGNLGQEVTVLPDGFREHLETILCGWTARLAACLRAAQHAGQLASQVDCDEMAAFFWIGWEGAVLRARLMRCDTPLQAFARGFLALLPH